MKLKNMKGFSLREFAGLPRSLYILLVGHFINRLGSFVVMFLAVNLTNTNQFTVEFIGVIVSILGVGSFLAGPLGGLLSDLYGRKKILVWSLLFNSILLLILALVKSKISILTVVFLLGFLGNMYRPAASSLISDIVPNNDFLRAYRLYHWSFNLAGTVGAALAGYILSKGFFLLSAINAFSSFIYALVIWIFIKEIKTQKVARKISLLSKPFFDPIFFKLFMITTIGNIVFTQLYVSWAIDLTKRGISTTEYGYLLSVNGLLIIFLQPLLGPYIRNFRPKYVLALSAILIGIGFGMNAFTGTFLYYLVSVAFWSLGEIISAGIVLSIAAKIAPIELKGVYQGTCQMTFTIPQFISPIFGSFILGNFGSTTLWISCFIINVFVAIAYLIFEEYDKTNELSRATMIKRI
ncbi:MFS transporter [Fluviispira vulneris]|uniref:MFS transporter n=1 Tax=Fluviispira vulneris TaxID=2763012 RepID=UPI00164927F0|nr:MFS transporter [Fluviispira vulneris]